MRGVRVAFVGKGGAGKSAIAGTFARALARRGAPVLALDSDPLPGLALSLGVPASDAPLPDEAIEERPDGERPRFALRAGLSADEAVERYAVRGPDGVRFLQFGKVHDSVRPLVASQIVFRAIVNGVGPRWQLVGDLPGGTRQAFFGWAGFADTLLVVVEPTAKSLLSARRLARLRLAEDAPRLAAVASKVRAADDVDRVRAGTGLDVVAAVPWDETFAEAERRGVAAIDYAPHTPAVAAVESLAEQLYQQEASTANARE